MNLWRYHSFWAKMKKSKFESVMKGPIQLYITRELIPQIYHNAVAQNVKELMSKTGYLEKDTSIIGQILSHLSQTTSIDIDAPPALTDRFFKVSSLYPFSII